jgi:hypothetical protein
VSKPLKEKVFREVPVRFHTDPSFITLIELIKAHNLESSDHLHQFLNQNISLLEKEVEKTKTAAFQAKTLHDQIMQLEALKKCQSLSKQFLNI